MKKKILGIGGSIHDFSSCILVNKKFTAIEDERITRIRYGIDSSAPCEASVFYCLDSLKLTLKDVDILVTNDDLEHFVNMLPESVLVEKINHHTAHAYSSFFTSNFLESAVFVADGAGSKKLLHDNIDETRETTTFAYGEKNKIQTLKKLYGTLDGYNPISHSQTIMSNSLGEFYRIVAQTMELGWLAGPGKMMGLASYGNSKGDQRFLKDIMDCITFFTDGGFEVITNGSNGLVDKIFQIREDYKNDKRNLFLNDAALANSAQIAFEEVLFYSLSHLHKLTKSPNLCLVGGAALNSIANGKIRKRTNFSNIHVVPFPGDNGLSIGSAIWGYLHCATQEEDNEEVTRFSVSAFLGKSYSSEEVEEAIIKSNLSFTKPHNLNEIVANYLCEGKVIGWFQGKAEFGPRALGNRSILADPRKEHIRDHINNLIKEREWYRPLAPSVLIEYATKYFDTEGCESKSMEYVTHVKKEYQNLLPAITHVDGTARLQTVAKEDNLKYYELIEAFMRISKIPVLLNTSFNIKGEPIVETPLDAISTFVNSKIDILVLEDYLVVKC